MRPVHLLLFCLMVVICAACGSGSPTTPDPASQDPTVIVDTPDLPAADDTNKSTTITIRTPAPLAHDPASPTIGITVIDVTDLVRGSSEIDATDRDKLYETANTTGNFLWDELQIAKPMSAPGYPWNGGVYLMTSPWGANQHGGGPAEQAYYNTWSDYNNGILTGVELFSLTDGTNQHVSQDIIDGFVTSINTGLYGEVYAYFVGATPDGDLTTKPDRCYAEDPTFFVIMANICQNPSYYMMARTCHDAIYYDSGEDGGVLAAFYVNDAYSPGNGRFSLALWDLSMQIKAAVLCGRFDFADEIAVWLNTNRLDWENVPFNGDDWTNLGWSAIAESLAMLEYFDGPLSTDAQALYDDAVEAITIDYTFREGNWGYWGFVDNNRLYDDSQAGAYALASLGSIDLYGTSTQAILDAADGGLEWFAGKILPFSTGIDFNGSGTPDNGVILSAYRGFVSGGQPFYYTPVAEAFRGITIATAQFTSYPDIPRDLSTLDKYEPIFDKLYPHFPPRTERATATR